MGAATVITSGKGGVGKSTVSVGMACALAKKGRRVLLVDCDAGLRSLDRMTGIEENLLYDLADVVNGRCAPAQAIYECSGYPGVFVMPAPARGEDMVGQKVMKSLVPVLKKYYDHVILDCPAGVGRGFRAACAAADRAILVCTPDPVCIRSCAAASGLLHEMGIEKQRLVINRYDSTYFRKIKTVKDLDTVIDETGVRLLGVVPEDEDFAASLLRGENPPAGCAASMALGRISGRLEGTRIPVRL